MKASLPTRRLIPRWRPTGRTLQKLEATAPDSAGSSGSPLRESEEELERAIALWNSTKEPGALGEVLAFSVDPTLVDKVLAVGYAAIEAGALVSPVQSALVHLIGKSVVREERSVELSSTPDSLVNPHQVAMRRLRSTLRVAPDNIIALMDFAQLQAALGKTNEAERALRTAIALCPNNRVALRTYARFLVHVARPDEAHRFIRRHPRTATDPWLMASEIALADAAGTPAAFIGKATRLLHVKGELPYRHATELAGVVAMAELYSGNLKKARDAQRIALLAPNDNVVAQAVDLEEFFGVSLDIPVIKSVISTSSEAQLLRAWSIGDPQSIERYALDWHVEEPFSSRPIQLLTALYAYRGLHDVSLRWSSVGLAADPTDQGLLVNRAYALAKSGMLVEARRAIRQLRHLHGKTIEPYALATEGLIAYQESAFDSGDRSYSAAVEQFEKVGRPGLAAYCRVSQALSATQVQHPLRQPIVEASEAAFQLHPTTDALVLIRTATIEGLDAPADSVPLAADRRLSQWEYDSKKNTLIERSGVTSRGARALKIKDS